MRSLASAALASPPKGNLLPTVFPTLHDFGIRPRMGTCTMLAATPASGKTYLALKWLKEMKLPTLYFSADADEATIVERMCSIITGESTDSVAADLRTPEGKEFHSDNLMDEVPFMRFVFTPDPTYDELVLELMAFNELEGDYPKVVAIDNLMNLVGENENEWGAMRDHTKAVKNLIRTTGASFFVLHHMSEDVKDPSVPAPRKSIQGKVSQLPEVILSLARAGDELRIAVVKNRYGDQSPSGEYYTRLYVDLGKGQFYDHKPQLLAAQGSFDTTPGYLRD